MGTHESIRTDIVLQSILTCVCFGSNKMAIQIICHILRGEGMIWSFTTADGALPQKNTKAKLTNYTMLLNYVQPHAN